MLTRKVSGLSLESSSGLGMLWRVSLSASSSFNLFQILSLYWDQTGWQEQFYKCSCPGTAVISTHAYPLSFIILIGSEVKSSYADTDDRPMAVCEFGGLVAVESKNFAFMFDVQLSVVFNFGFWRWAQALIIKHSSSLSTVGFTVGDHKLFSFLRDCLIGRRFRWFLSKLASIYWHNIIFQLLK